MINGITSGFLEVFIFYLLFGIPAGIISGLLGIGGGVVLVPFLLWQLPRHGVPDNLVMLVALGTSFSVILFTSLASTQAHQRRGAIRWKSVGYLTPGLLLGTAAGSQLASHLPGKHLIVGFALFLGYVGYQLLRTAKGGKIKPVLIEPQSVPESIPWHLPWTGIFIGVLSALFGIGGGSLTVPYLERNGQNIRQAVGTSAACGFPIALSGTLSYLNSGWNTPGLPAHCLGYLFWPGSIALLSTSLLFAPLGANLAHRLPMPLLKRIFGCVVCFIALKLLWQSEDIRFWIVSLYSYGSQFVAVLNAR